jgi:Flagellar protein YcgR/PilZ domain
MPNANDQSVQIAFDALRLYPGAAMYIQTMAEGSHTRHKVQFIGTIKGKSLLVTLPVEDGKGMWMQAGQTFVVRGFNGIYAYAFSTQVIRARAHPFPYIHFFWPREVGCQLVRKSLRVEVALPANVSLADNSTVAVTMLDLSAPGSMLDSPAALGAIGDHAKIGFTVDVEGNPTNLNLAVNICNIHQKEDGSGFRIGIGFENVAKNDALILHYFINNIALGSNLKSRATEHKKKS